MNHLPTLIFDLDGTLIDSAKSILKSLNRVFEEAGTLPAVPLSDSLIGPPLQETLELLCGTSDEKIIKNLVVSFQDHYDGGGYKEAEVYPGINDLLEKLRQHGYPLHLATNKRLVPTQKIMQHLGWSGYFRSIHTLDMHSPRQPHKAALLNQVLHQHQISPHAAIYIGDKLEDGLAATRNELDFIGVTWGYGDFSATSKEGWRIATSVQALLDHIESRTSENQKAH